MSTKENATGMNASKLTKDRQYEMRFTGSGGQGVILTSIILAEAAVVDGMITTQSQVYGPQARGGLCKAETIISDTEIHFTKVRRPDFLLAMNQASLDKYAPQLSEDALILTDASLQIPDGIRKEQVVSLPIIETARDKVGKVMTANIVAVGAINSLLGLFSDESLSEAVRRHIPAGTEELNMKALEAGKTLTGRAV